MYSDLFKIDDGEIYNIFYSFFKEHKEHSDWRFNCKIDKKLGNIIFEAEMSRDRIKGGIKFDVVENYNDTNPTYSKDIQQRQHQGFVVGNRHQPSKNKGRPKAPRHSAPRGCAVSWPPAAGCAGGCAARAAASRPPATAPGSAGPARAGSWGRRSRRGWIRRRSSG